MLHSSSMGRALLAGTFLFALPLGSKAHEESHPLQGEQFHKHETASEAFWNLVIPEAEAAASFTVKGAYRYINGNGYPDIPPGQFPNRNNPHSISKKNYQLKVPVNPKKTGNARTIRNQPFGIALNGVLFEPATAETWQNNRRSGWNYEALGGKCRLGLDKYNAHVQPDGTYHYHAMPTGLMSANGGHSTPALLGYAADGFPIYGNYGYADPDRVSSVRKLKSSYRVKSGSRPNGPGGRYNGAFTQDYQYGKGWGDLDQCNGRFAVTPEYPQGTYHYVLTDTFPFIPRCWMGSPDSSFARLKNGPGGNRRGDAGPADGMQTGAQVQSAAFTGAQDVPVIKAQLQPRHPPRQRDGRRSRSARQGQAGPCSGN